MSEHSVFPPSQALGATAPFIQPASMVADTPPPEFDQTQQTPDLGQQVAGPAAPHVSVARHILDALGGSDPNQPMGWAKSILAGSLAGAANVGRVPEGGGFLAGAGKGFQGQQEVARQHVLDQQRVQQQQFENQLKMKQDARAEQELQIHMEDTKVRRAMWNAQTAGAIQQQQQNAARFKDLQQEDQLRVKELGQKVRDLENQDLAILSENGVDITKLDHITSYDQLSSDHAKQAGAGSIFAVPNGQEHKEGEDGAGAYIVPGDVWSKEIEKPFTLTTSYDVGKNGSLTPKTITVPAGTKVSDLLAISKGAQLDLAKKQQQVFDQAKLASQTAQTREANANAANKEAETRLLNSGTAAGGWAVAGNVDPRTGANEQYLASLPPGMASQVKAIGEGRVEVNSRMFQSKQGQELAAALNQAYPGFDQSKAQSYFKMRQDFTSGKTSVGLNSYNTGIAHLGTMWDHLANANSAELNAPWSTLHRQLDLDKQLVSTELAKAVSNGQMTEGEKKEILSGISGYTVNSYRDRIREAVELLHGKQEAYQEQWNNGAPPGAVSQVHIISPQAEQTIAKIKGQPQQPPVFASAPGKPRLMSTDGGKTWQPAQ